MDATQKGKNKNKFILAIHTSDTVDNYFRLRANLISELRLLPFIWAVTRFDGQVRVTRPHLAPR